MTATMDELVEEALPQVGYIATKLMPKLPYHVKRDDLEGAGRLGLVEAFKTFDPSRGVPFEKFAQIRIHGAMLDELRSLDWATRSTRATLRKMHQIEDDLRVSLSREPTTHELAEKLDISCDELAKLRYEAFRTSVLNYDSIMETDAEAEVLPADEDSPERQFVAQERLDDLHDAIAALPDRLRRIIIGYYFDNREMEDIAQELGVSGSRVSQLVFDAKKRIYRYLIDKS